MIKLFLDLIIFSYDFIQESELGNINLYLNYKQNPVYCK